MKKIISILICSLLPSLAMAADDHSGHHDHDMAEMQPHIQGVGQLGKEAEVSRTINIEMDDNMRFLPSQIEVQVGETVRLQVKNLGKVAHELVIGDVASLQAHAEMMRKMPDMEHDDPNMINLQPGEQGELIWTFDQAGTVDFACLIPGHLESGMKGQVQVNNEAK